MPVTMKDCQSSHIAKHGYDPETQSVHIEFASGGSGAHGNVTPEQYQAFDAAPSIGSAYHAMFRGKSAHPWTPAGKESGAKHAGNETHPLAGIEGIDDA